MTCFGLTIDLKHVILFFLGLFLCFFVSCDRMTSTFGMFGALDE